MKDIIGEWRKTLLEVVDAFLDYKIPEHKWFTEYTKEETKRQEFRNKLYRTIDRFFDNSVKESVNRLFQNNKRREKLDLDYLSVTDFLYWNPPLGGMPDSSLRIGVDFEVGGTYEDWGFVVEQKRYDSEKKIYNYKTVATGRGLVETLLKARGNLKKEFAESITEKCECGNELVGYKVEKNGSKIPQCINHLIK